MKRLKTLFRDNSFALVVIIIMNLIVLYNSFFHNPLTGYDAGSHIKNIQIYPFRLPSPEESSEYFSAPLPYMLPSIFNFVCQAFGWPNCTVWAGKIAQLINFILSIGISILYWKILDIFKPGNKRIKELVFLNLAILTVYYRTFSQVRGEPYIAFFVVFLIYYIIKLISNLYTVTWIDALMLGVILGLLILSRQWGFLIFPALGVVFITLWFKNKDIRIGLLKFCLLTLIITLFIGGWFYLHLYIQYGSITAFNLESPGFHFSNLPNSFYRTTGLQNYMLFTYPVRPNFDFTLYPILYSDTWGDYWAYFSYRRNAENALQTQSYLGRVNIVSIFPSLLILISLIGSIYLIVKNITKNKISNETVFGIFQISMIFFTMLGFLWFLISYPEKTNGDTNKATYIIQVFMVLPLLTSIFLERILKTRDWIYSILTITYLLVLIHNFQAFLTKFYWINLF